MKTEGSPLRRAGYVKFLENLAIGLGNSHSDTERVIQTLGSKLGQHGPTLDEHILWAITALQRRALENARGNASARQSNHAHQQAPDAGQT